MTTILVVFLLVVVAGVGGAVVLARRSKDAYDTANEVVPGVATRAPASWAGDHSAEARLHRRLRDAVAALRANPVLDQPTLAGSRSRLESEALAIDDRLVAVAALPATTRADPLARIEAAAEALEAATAALVENDALAAAPVDDALRDIQQRLDILAQARAELDEA